MGHLGSDAVLVVAADVVGRGANAGLQAGYLRGWLDGFRTQLTLTPDLAGVATRFQGCLQTARIEAAWFIALLQHTAGHTVAYSALASGFPPPLLLVGSPPSTHPSLTPGRPEETQRVLLTAPWRLAMASDGLLQRLGSGNESRGVAALRSWLTGPARDQKPANFLSDPEEATDDELYAELRWEGWDEARQFMTDDHAQRHQVLAQVETFVGLGKDDTPMGRAAANAVAEAIDNAAQHGYGGKGKVQVSFRNEGNRLRVEIEDASKPTPGAPGDGRKLMDHHASSVDYWYGESGGTVVSLAFEVEPVNADE